MDIKNMIKKMHTNLLVSQTNLKELSSGPTYLKEWLISRREKGNWSWGKEPTEKKYDKRQK